MIDFYYDDDDDYGFDGDDVYEVNADADDEY